MASPAVLRPIEHGAGTVLHSLTKFISGDGDVTGGLVLGKGRRDGAGAGRDDPRRDESGSVRRMARDTRSPPLAVRLERQSASALALAAFLEKHPAVERVYHPVLASHPQHALARRLMPRIQGAMRRSISAAGRSPSRP